MQAAFPPVMLQLLREATKPNPDFEALSSILGLDPMLSATVLNLANSPYFGSAQKVTNLKRAATILGTKEILKLALSITYQKHLQEGFKEQGLDFYASWRLVIWTAIAAELLAERLCPEQADQAYIAALFKDISLLNLVCAGQDLAECHGANPVLAAFVPGQLERERVAWGVDHCQLSTQILAQWGIPLPKLACIEHHHDFDRLEELDPLCQCLALATRWSELELDSADNPSAVVHFRALLQRRLDLPMEETDRMVNRCANRFLSVLSTLGLDEAHFDSRYYLHSLTRMQSYNFLASELAGLSGGIPECARVIARHLKWEWNIEDWELALAMPRYGTWELFASAPGGGTVRQASAESFELLPWCRPRKEAFPLACGGKKLGELRLARKAFSAETLRDLQLYLRFLCQSYIHFAVPQAMLELKAHTLDQLPVGVARLTLKGVILEANVRLRWFLGLENNGRGLDLWNTLSENKGFSRDAEWERFLAEPSFTAIHKIFCLWKGVGHSEDTCVYLAAEKRQWQGGLEILLFMDDVSLVAGWEYKALKQGEFLEKLINSMRDCVMTVDGEGRVTFASPQVRSLLDRNLFEVSNPAPVHHGNWGPEFLAATPVPVEVSLTVAGGGSRNLELIFSELPRQSDGSKQWLVVGRDLTAVRRLEEKLKRLALFDGLTGLLNHYQFHVVLDREVERSRRTGRAVGLIFFDLDNFKAVNDSKGHQAGDDVLRVVARILSANMRKGTDYPCRYGGDEFAAVITEVDKDMLQILAARLATAVADFFKGGVTLSVGLAALAPGESPSSLLRRADQASYAAKGQGGNRIVWAQDE